MTLDERLLISLPEVRTATGFSNTTVWRLVKDGTLPSVKIGRRTMVDARKFLAMIEGQK
jgi:predicted DNA-binding transcriptional regulator AlpA